MVSGVCSSVTCARLGVSRLPPRPPSALELYIRELYTPWQELCKTNSLCARGSSSTPTHHLHTRLQSFTYEIAIIYIRPTLHSSSTPRHTEREQLRSRSHVLLTNPDMLHGSMLAAHK